MVRLLSLINHVIASSGGEEESVSDILMHHITDHVLTTGFIGKINETILNEKLFGIFDMRITKWVLMLWITLIACLIVFIPLSRKIKKNLTGSKSRWVNLWETLISFVHDEIVEPNFHGKAAKKATPYFLTLFFFILFANFFGLVPGAATATANLGVTAALALCTLIGIFGVGIVKQGPLWLVKGFVPGGIPAPLFPVMWVLELVGLFIKPFALMIRLFANMTAGHIIITILLYFIIMFQALWVGIPSIAGSLMIYLLELLVAFIQAYIFTMLSSMFIGESMHSH
ncbi:MAG: F0F1 ATP synthase subunit A [Leptospirales bacterium]|nr:F0F1 ATP synthase subunit A [Leptospirales bacterium]